MVLCQRVIEDAHTQNLSLVHCLERIEIHELPCYYQGFAFASVFSRGEAAQSPEDWEFRLVRTSAPKETKTIITATARWEPHVERLRVFVNFAVLILTEAGTLSFRLDWRQRDQGRWHHGQDVPLQIEMVALPAEEQQALQALRLSHIPDQ